MILINKEECEKLINMGYSFKSGDIHRTVGKGKKKTYYATESQKLMKDIKMIRSND